MTKKLIRQIISQEIIEKMKKNYICEELAIVLETSFVDPQTVDFLIRL